MPVGSLLFVLSLLPSAEPPADIKTAVDAAAADAMKNHSRSALVIGVVRGDERGVFGYGSVGRDSDIKPDGKTVFEIGSITKVFTAALLADLEREGIAKADDPVAKHLPAGTAVPSRGGKEITLGHLADHSSGLPRLPTNLAPKDAGNPYADYSADRLYEFLKGHTLARDIGSHYEYSNLGAGLLGHALERAGGKPYERLLIERICEPLGMADTRIALTDGMRKRLAPGQGFFGMAAGNWDFDCLAGCGALRSTTDDLMRFLDAAMCRGPAAESPVAKAIRACQTPRVDAGGGTKVGLGWHITPLKDTGRTIIWHNGGTGGYRSFLGFTDDRKVGVVVLLNRGDTLTGVDPVAVELLKRLSR
jgi:CubicO group peptidase (beta-lactamase class C family)